MKRDWTIDVSDDEGMADAYDALGEVFTILMRLGGVVAIAPHRVQQEAGYAVDKIIFKYDSYAPGLNQAPIIEQAESPPPLAVVENGAEADSGE